MSDDTNAAARNAAILKAFEGYIGAEEQNRDHAASALEIILRRARENGLDPEHVVEAFEMGMGAWLALRKYLEVFK